MKGLIVLVPYNAGQEFYPDYGYDDDYYDQDEVEEEGEEDEQEDNLDESSTAITEDEDESDDDYDEEESDNDSDKSYNSSEAYLPVYVETDDEDMALMAVAYAACVDYCYVAFPSDGRTAQE